MTASATDSAKVRSYGHVAANDYKRLPHGTVSVASTGLPSLRMDSLGGTAGAQEQGTTDAGVGWGRKGGG